MEPLRSSPITTATSTRYVGYLLVLHGSHDPHYHQAIEQLMQALSTHLAPQARYQVAFLECSATPLHQQIEVFAQQLALEQIPQMWILPLFLLPGVHVMQDIPAEVVQAQSSLADQGLPVELLVQPHLGTQISSAPMAIFPTSLHMLLAQCFAAAAPNAARILVAHGTRRPGGNTPLIALADAVQAVPAYWFVPPSLEARVAELYAHGVREVVVLPYVLLAGSLTDGIRQQILTLAGQFPTMQITQLPALHESGVLLELILQRCQPSCE